jgi:phage/plasmid-associated DNA primase
MLEETKVVDIKQDSANSISEYFKKLLDKDVNVLMADEFEHKKDYLEIPLSALYNMYKDWCVDAGHNRMQSSEYCVIY